MKDRRVRVAGIGNAMAGDDAIGLHVVEEVRQQHWPGVECMTEALPGPDLFEALSSNDLLIVIDACQTGASAGSIILFSPEELSDSGVRLCSSHGLGLIDWIQLAEETGETQPQMRIFGVEVTHYRMGEGLSEIVVAAVPALLGFIRTEIDNAG